MEKVIIISGTTLEQHHANRLNVELEKGWTVKSVTPISTKDTMASVFILEKR